MQQLLAGLLLLAAAAIWGFTFPLVKDALEEFSSFQFLAIRFGIATVVLAAITPKAARKIFRTGLIAGGVTGALLAAGHAFQMAGLERTLSTNAGFITGLYVVFTPLLAALILRRSPATTVMLGVVLTTTGLSLMSLQISSEGVRFHDGDLLVLVAAIAYAGQIVALAAWSPRSDPRVLTLQQLFVTAAVFTILMPLQPIRAPVTGTVWLAILATALGSTVFGIFVQTWAQQKISPTRAALIFSMEAPFAALAGFLLADERLGPRAWLGAALIFGGMLIAELKPAPKAQEAVSAEPPAA